jgi:hypothetical protein
MHDDSTNSQFGFSKTKKQVKVIEEDDDDDEEFDRMTD